MKNKRLVFILGSVFLILLIPMIAMQFSNEVNWTFLDFVIAGILLLSAALILAYAYRKVHRFEYRIVVIIAVIAVFLLIWAELAVGIFGSPFAGS